MRRFDHQGADATRDNMRSFVTSLDDHGVLAVPVKDAIATVLATSTPHTYVRLCEAGGWDTEHYPTWLGHTLAVTRLDGSTPRA